MLYLQAADAFGLNLKPIGSREVLIKVSESGSQKFFKTKKLKISIFPDEKKNNNKSKNCFCKRFRTFHILRIYEKIYMFDAYEICQCSYGYIILKIYERLFELLV